MEKKNELTKIYLYRGTSYNNLRIGRADLKSFTNQYIDVHVAYHKGLAGLYAHV